MLTLYTTPVIYLLLDQLNRVLALYTGPVIRLLLDWLRRWLWRGTARPPTQPAE
jgi:hypothetical protein